MLLLYILYLYTWESKTVFASSESLPTWYLKYSNSAFRKYNKGS